jgi:hypothetical protein
MAAFDEVMFVYSDDTMTEASFARHLRELAEAIDSRDESTRIGVIYDAPKPFDTDAKRRQRSAQVLDARRAKLARTTAAFALATPSPIVRGTLRAVFWVAPPPYPWEITDNVRSGLQFVAKHMTLDVEGCLARYQRLKQRHFP